MTSPISIELSSIKVDQRASEETYSYTAILHVDGRAIGTVGNSGRGGCDRFLAPAKGLEYGEASRLYDEACRRVPLELPEQNLADSGEPPNMVTDSLEYHCARLVTDHLLRKTFNNDLKRNVLFYANGLPADGATASLGLFRINDAKGHTKDRLIQHVRSKHPSAYILNEQNEADAFSAYKRMA